MNSYLDTGDSKQAIADIEELKPPKKYLPEMVSYLILHTLDRSGEFVMH